MTPKRWWQNLVYLIMSLFVAWHTVAMVLAPFQAQGTSATPPSFRFFVQAYLTFFRLENTWAFFAPVGRSHQFRYVIEDNEGNEHIFAPVKEFRWFDPHYGWFERKYWGLMIYPQLFSDYFVNVLCRNHAWLNPESITLQEVLEEEFRPEDHLNGYRPLDPEFSSVTQVKYAACPSEPRPDGQE
jgi:hypothetical protein